MRETAKEFFKEYQLFKENDESNDFIPFLFIVLIVLAFCAGLLALYIYLMTKGLMSVLIVNGILLLVVGGPMSLYFYGKHAYAKEEPQ